MSGTIGRLARGKLDDPLFAVNVDQRLGLAPPDWTPGEINSFASRAPLIRGILRTNPGCDPHRPMSAKSLSTGHVIVSLVDTPSAPNGRRLRSTKIPATTVAGFVR